MQACVGEEPFWDFALAAYAREGVARECLVLQDEHGASVMLLLFLCWCAAERGGLAAGARQRAFDSARLMERHFAAPLRAARRALSGVRRADRGALQAMLAHVRAAELAAERAQARALAATVPRAEPADDAFAGACELLTGYLASLPLPPSPEMARRLAVRVLGEPAYPRS